MVPSRRDNMIAWLAARCDAPDYGKLIVYEFPQGEACLRAVPDRGADQSEYGDLATTHVVEPDGLAGDPRCKPACDSDRELDPLRIAALFAGPARTPELKRVIAAYGEHVVMKETLAEALSALFMESPAAQAVSSTTEGMPLTSPTANQARQALDRYNQAVKRLKSGDWKGFGTEFDAMRELLEEMNRGSSGH
jgi:uncharacterized membrane protein (UPF0182 family)